MILERPASEVSNVGRVEVEVLSKCPFIRSEQSIKLTNFTTGKQTKDTLHVTSTPIKCNSRSCKGALMSGQTSEPPPIRSREDVLTEAANFQEQYFASLKNGDRDKLQERIADIRKEILASGTYSLTLEELQYAAKLAWRNASRCIGRIQWNRLELQDCRHITSTEEMYLALCRHLEFATNEGNIRSMITVFPQRVPGREDYRLWNPQLINFAGYLQPDGTVLGDPARVQFTRLCRRLGWKGQGGRFDILPWILSAPGEQARYYDVPESLCLMVHLEHPRFTWFADLGLKWYAVPAVADMMLDVGGVAFTACPFNGWYMATEVGARNLCDVQRYNVGKEVAEKMNLDTSTPTSLWKDTVLVETTLAVLHSFHKNKVTIVDHHTAAETFMKHLETEQKVRGGCPADWVWIVPPIGGSSTPVYHQEMICYNLKPSYEYQEKAWVTYKWPKNENVKLKYSFASVAKTVRCCLAMMSGVRCGRTQVTILYATETGKSETFARRLEMLLHASFNARVMCMEDYNLEDLASESFIAIVASTFGSGEPPDNGKVFWNDLKKIKASKSAVLGHLKFAVFALGSSQYPDFCNFGKNVGRILTELGAKSLMPVETGDELKGQEHTFNHWLPEIYKVSCREFKMEVAAEMLCPVLSLTVSWKPENFRLVTVSGKEEPVLNALSKLHNKKLYPMKVLSRAKLQASYSDHQTLLVRLDTSDESALTYEPGDHIAIFPSNPVTVVQSVVHRLEARGIRCDQLVQVENLKDGSWGALGRLPASTLKTYLSRYLDITSPPSASFLQLLSDAASSPWDKYRLKRLSQVTDDYEEWKSFRYPHLGELLEEFSSASPDPCLLLCELPLLQPRYYSISSSRAATPGEVHVTLSLVSYRTQDNKGPIHRGVCTSFLDSFPEDEIPCFIKTAPRFHLPADPTLPIIMIGAGSGIAPFRSFWQERDALVRKTSLARNVGSESAALGPLFLFFGCRQPSVDNIYEQETAALVRKGVLTKVFTAFSRQPGKPKTYVQHELAKQSALVAHVVATGGHIYVCGDAVMAADVRSVVGKVLLESGTELESMVENGTYHEDIFGVLHRR